MVPLLCRLLVINRLHHFLGPLRAENGWAWRKSWHQEFKERICIVSLLSRLIAGEPYFKLQKTSWTFPEFLQRHRSIDQNNQEEPTGLLNATWVFYLSKQKVTSWKRGEISSPGKHLQFAAGNKRKCHILIPLSWPGHKNVDRACLLHGLFNEQLPHKHWVINALSIQNNALYVRMQSLLILQTASVFSSTKAHWKWSQAWLLWGLLGPRWYLSIGVETLSLSLVSKPEISTVGSCVRHKISKLLMGSLPRFQQTNHTRYNMSYEWTLSSQEHFPNWLFSPSVNGKAECRGSYLRRTAPSAASWLLWQRLWCSAFSQNYLS
jgi:hypothetical protein